VESEAWAGASLFAKLRRSQPSGTDLVPGSRKTGFFWSPATWEGRDMLDESQKSDRYRAALSVVKESEDVYLKGKRAITSAVQKAKRQKRSIFFRVDLTLFMTVGEANGRRWTLGRSE